MYPFAFHLLALEFAVLAPIRGLPHFPGPHWSALFRNLFHTLEAKLKAVNPTVWVQPVETGILEYEAGDRLSLGLVVPAAAVPALEEVLGCFNRLAAGRGHFQPGVTLRLENVTSRFDGRPWWGAGAALLSREMVAAEVKELCVCDRFTLLTLSPLRIPRPPGRKESGHRYCDADFFLRGNDDEVCRRLLEKVRGLAFDTFPMPADGTLKVSGGALNWLDVAYAGKTMGGVVGALEISGRPGPAEALYLVLGQYLGVGKNAAFGLGFYRIPELDPVRTIRPLVRSTTLFARAVTPEALSEALARLPDSSPGPDGMDRSEALAAGPPFLEKTRQCIGCGACTIVCPTCACFDIDDYSELDLASGRRVRTWDSCQLKPFTRVAGNHIFRDTRVERFKHRIYHQIQYFKERHDEVFCTGCGRCIRGCPTKIDWVEAINKL